MGSFAVAFARCRRNLFAVIAILVAAPLARAEIVTGSYTGNGAATRAITGLSFRPDIVIIKGNNAQPAIIRTSSMPAGRSKQLSGDASEVNRRITGFTAIGFTIDDDPAVNAVGVEYGWTAFSNDPGFMTIGSYSGDGALSRDVTGLGFDPVAVFVIPASVYRPYWKTTAMPAGQSMAFDDAALRTGMITDFVSGGFRISGDPGVNQFNNDFYYVAWAAKPTSLAVGSYRGNGLSKQDVHVMGFTPEWAMLKAGEALPGVQKPDALGADKSGFFSPEVFTNQALKKLEGGGIEVGNDYRVNELGRRYYYFAVEDNHTKFTDLQVGLSVDNSTPLVGQQIAYTATVLNAGPDDGTGAAVTILLPAGLTYVSSAPSVGTYDAATGIWTIGNLAKNVSRSLVMTANVAPPAGGQTLTTTAVVTSLVQSDPNGTNNSASVIVTVPGADLAVTLLLDQAAPNAGQQIQYTVNLTNNGPLAAGGVNVVATWSAGLQINSASSGVGSYNPATRIWTVGALNAGATATLIVLARPRADTGGQTLAASVAAASVDIGDPFVANNVSSVSLTVNNVSSDLAVALAVDDAQPDEGQAVTFLTTLTNDGPDANTGIVISFALPAGLTYLGHSAAVGTYDGAGTWSVGGLAAGSSTTLQITATVNVGAGGTTHTAIATVVDADQPDLNPANDAASIDVAVTNADLGLVITVDNPSPNQGDTITFKITLRNNGPSVATNAAVTITMPVELSYVSSIAENGTYDGVAGVWTVPNLAAGAAQSLQVVATVAGAIGGQSLTTTATITAADQSDHVPANDLANVVIGVTSADLGLAMTVDDVTPDEGQPIIYTVTLANAGPDDATGVGVAIVLPDGFAFSGDLPSAGSFSSATGIWSVASIQGGNSATLQMTGIVDAGTAGATLAASANISDSDQSDAVGANNSAVVSFTVTSVDLEIGMVVSDATPDEGQAVAVTVTLTNLGPDAATGTAVAVVLPAGLTYVGNVPALGSYNGAGGIWTVGALASGTSTTLQLNTNVDVGLGGSTLTATAAVAAADRGDPVSGNNSGSVSLTVTLADVAIGLSVDNALPHVGQTVNLTVTATNNGPDAVGNLLMNVALPAGLVYAGHVAGAGAFDDEAGLWNIGGLAVGVPVALQISAMVDTGTSGMSLTTTAAIAAADQADPDASNNVATIVVTATSADVGVAMTVDDAAPDAGQTIVYTVVLSNAGPDAASGLAVHVVLPVDVSFAGSSAVTGVFDGATGIWSVNGLAAGGAAALQISAIVAPGAGGTVQTATAAITAADQGDLVAGNNTASLDVTISSADVAVNVAVDNVLPNVGQTVNWMVTATNNGPDAATALALNVTLPGGMTYVSHAAGAGTFDNLVGVWTIGGLAAGLSDTLQVVATVADSAAGQVLSFTAVVGVVDQSDPVTNNNAATVTVRATNADLALGAAFDVTGPRAGDTAVLRVTLRNNGPDMATGIVVAVNVPPTLTVTAAAGGSGAYTAGTGLWQVASLAADRADTLVLSCVVGTVGFDVDVTATAGIAAVDQFDTVVANNTVSASVTTGGLRVVQATVNPFAQEKRRLMPGGPADDVLQITLINNANIDFPLSTVTFANPVTGAGGQADQDAAWNGLELFRRIGDVTTPVSIAAGGSRSGNFSAGLLTFTGLTVAVSARDTLHLVLRGAAALAAPDGLELRPEIPNAAALTFAPGISAAGVWPLAASGVLAVDGMTAAQIAIRHVGAEVFQLGSFRNLAFDITVPANGGVADRLTRLNVQNHGTAEPRIVLTRMEAWADDGDGIFDAARDARISEMYWTGGRWEATGLSYAVPVAGLRVMVVVDVAADALGGTIRLGLPSGDDTGIGVYSGNDGPVDEPVINQFTQTVSATDRVIVTTAPIVTQVLAPGQTATPLLHVLARNLYAAPQVLGRLRVRDVGHSPGGATTAQRDSILTKINVRLDGNGDGVLGSVSDDPIIGSAVFENGLAVFDGLNWILQPDAVSYLFVTGAVSLTRAADGDTIAAVIGSGADLQFGQPLAMVGSWPLDSGARHRVDGMVAAQIKCVEVPPVSLTPNEGPVLALDLTVPGNGHRSDMLTQLRLVNRGTATTADIASLQLWLDDGDGVFTPGGDTPIGVMAGVDTTWVAPSLNLTVPVRGVRLFAGVTVTGTPTSGVTLRLAVPTGGVTVASANDGPRDRAVVGPTSLLISTAPLLSYLQIAPPRSTTGQTVTATMSVANVSGEDVVGIVPQNMLPGGSGGLVNVGGPVPASLDLAAGATGSFTWTYNATAIGNVYLAGSCEGTGAVGGQIRRSLNTASGTHIIVKPAAGLSVYPVANMPISINRGQAGVVPLTVTFVNNGDESTADVRLNRIVVSLDNGVGGGVVPSSLLTRASVSEGVSVYCDRTSVESTGRTITLDLVPAVIVTTREPVTLGLRLDIRADTVVPAFRVLIAAAGDLAALDHVNGAAMPVNLLSGSFPVSSGTGNLVAQASGLIVSIANMETRTAGVGQTSVELMRLDLLGSGDDAFPSDVRIGSFTVAITDTFGRRLGDAFTRLEKLRIVSPLATHADVALSTAADSMITLQFLPPIVVPVGSTSIPLSVLGRVRGDAVLGPIRVRLESAALFDARDGNVGAAVPVIYQPTDIVGPAVLIQSPVSAVTVSATSQLPATINLGSRGVSVLTLHVAHPGSATTAGAVIDTLLFTCLNGLRQPLDPAALCDRLRISWRGAVCADLPPPSATNGIMRIPLTGVRLNAQEAGDLVVVMDLETSVPADRYEIVLPASGLVGRDVNLGAPVVLEPAAGTTPPYSSGLAYILTTAEELLVNLVDRMPPLLVGDGKSIVIAELSIRNTAAAGAGDLVLSGLTLRGRDAGGAPRPLGAVCAETTAFVGEDVWALTANPAATDSTLILTGAAPLVIPAATTVIIRLQASFLAEATGGLRFGVAEFDIAAAQPNGAPGSVSVRPTPGTAFPYWTAVGHFSGLDLASSYINFPNPFAAGRESTSFAFALAQAAEVTLRLVTARGEDVATLIDGLRFDSGLHQDIGWDGRNERGQTVRNGVYLAELLVSYADGSRERLLRKVAVVR